MPKVLRGWGLGGYSWHDLLQTQKLRVGQGRSMIANRSLAVTVVPLVNFWSIDSSFNISIACCLVPLYVSSDG